MEIIWALANKHKPEVLNPKSMQTRNIYIQVQDTVRHFLEFKGQLHCQVLTAVSLIFGSKLEQPHSSFSLN